MSRSPGDPIEEQQAVRERYARRESATGDWRYNMLNPSVWQSVQERQRATLRLLVNLGWHDLSTRRVVEVGCGSGGNLIELVRDGFNPANLQGIELLEERYKHARRNLPSIVRLLLGDACEADIPPASQDLVLQSTVFSSLLDDGYQQHLANIMWRWVCPGGGVLWYDFTVDNPRNLDVRGVPVKRVRTLFPEGRIRWKRITLAPPIARWTTRVHPSLYSVFNVIPLLRTHILAWIEKPLNS